MKKLYRRESRYVEKEHEIRAGHESFFENIEFDKEVPSVEGKVKDITAYSVEGDEVRHPELERTGLEFHLEGRKEKFVFRNCPFRIDNGETVIVYSEMLGYRHDPGFAPNTLKVDGLQVLVEDGSVVRNVKFQMSNGMLYFKEESQARKPPVE